MGVGFPNATYWVCTQTGTNADLPTRAFPARAAQCVWSDPRGVFIKKQSTTRGARASHWDAAYTDTSLHSRRGFLLHITISIHSFGVQSRNVNSSTVLSFLCPFVSPQCVTASLCLRGTCTRRWTPPSSSGPISHSQSKCKCPVWTEGWWRNMNIKKTGDLKFSHCEEAAPVQIHQW